MCLVLPHLVSVLPSLGSTVASWTVEFFYWLKLYNLGQPCQGALCSGIKLSHSDSFESVVSMDISGKNTFIGFCSCFIYCLLIGTICLWEPNGKMWEQTDELTRASVSKRSECPGFFYLFIVILVQCIYWQGIKELCSLINAIKFGLTSAWL